MPTLAQLESDSQAGQIVTIFSADGPIDHWSVLGPAVVIDGMSPLPDVGWVTTDGGQTFTPPPPDSILANQAALLARIPTAIQDNKAWLDRAVQPTQLQVLQQVDRLTRQITVLLRVIGKQLDSQTGT